MSVSLIDGHIDDDRMIDNEIIKATDNEIIKALEDWMKNFEGKAVDYMKISFALDLINRQKAEIERLKGLKNHHQELIDELNKGIAEARVEAVKEFVKRAKEKAYPFPCAIGVEYAVTIRALDETKTEMVGEG